MTVKQILFFVLQLATVAYMATDIYLASLPAIHIALDTTPELAQFTLSIYLLALGITQFIYGPLSDRFGRKPIIIFGLAVGIVGSILCTFADSIYWLLFARFVQGCGLGFSVSVSRTLIIDVFQGKETFRVVSLVSIAIPVVMMIAPILGGYIQEYIGWRGNFAALTLYCIFLLALVLKYLPETNKHIGEHSLSVNRILKNYKLLIMSPWFMGYTLCFSAALSGVFSYLAASPYLLQTLVGLSPVEYGWTMIITTVVSVVAGYINSRLVTFIAVPKLILLSSTGMILSGIWMMMNGYFNMATVAAILLPACLFLMMQRMTSINSYIQATLPFPKMTGTASAIFGGFQIILGSATSGIIAILPETNSMPLGWVLLGLGILTMISITITQFDKNRPQEIKK